MQKPSFWRLLGAYAIDFIITFFAAWMMWKLFWVCFPHALTGKGDMDGMALLLCLLVMCAFIPNLLYFAGSECLWKKTPGKWLLGVEVLDERNKRPSVRKLLKAYGIDFLLSIPVPTACTMVGLLLQAIIIFDRRVNTIDHCITVGIVLLFLSMIVLYFPICESIFGKTLGKKLMGLQVVQAAPQKQKEETK